MVRLTCFATVITVLSVCNASPLQAQGLNGGARMTTGYGGGSYYDSNTGNAWQLAGNTPYYGSGSNYYGVGNPNYYWVNPNYSQIASNSYAYRNNRNPREWTAAMQKLYPNAPYTYYGYAMPGSEYNNPLNLYGQAQFVPTVFNPQFIAGTTPYHVQIQKAFTGNYYAPNQYLPVVKP